MNQGRQAHNQPITDLESLQIALHELIPVSGFMGIKAVSYDGNKLVLEAPLAPNVNHQMSAFGGSLFSVSALAGWSLMQLKLAELKLTANTVIAGGDVGYSAPVFEDIRCEISLPNTYSEFAERLKANGKASLQLTSGILLKDQTEPAMAFSGKYVIRQI